MSVSLCFCLSISVHCILFQIPTWVKTQITFSNKTKMLVFLLDCGSLYCHSVSEKEGEGESERFGRDGERLGKRRREIGGETERDRVRGDRAGESYT